MFRCRAPADFEIPEPFGLAIHFLSRQQGVSMRVCSVSGGLKTWTYAKESELEVSTSELPNS